ncbi:MAG: DUF4139 domain-containing protein, partial [Thermoanaerobaculia bacterium]
MTGSLVLMLALAPGQAEAERAEAGAAAPAVEEKPLATRIALVTLYSDQALVVRQGAVELPAGRSRWEAPRLPQTLKDEAVRARIIRGAGARLANLEVLLRHRTVFKKQEAEEADRKLKDIQARHRRAADGLAALEREAQLLRAFEIGKRPPGTPQNPVASPIDVAAWEATLRFVDEGLAANRARARELLLELDGIEEELAVAAAYAQKLASSHVQSEKSVVLEFDAASAGSAEFEIAYLVPGPGWWPRYDIRADVGTGKVEMTSHALVRQETGEDWEGVELTFSGAEPARAADLPELLAWHIGEDLRRGETGIRAAALNAASGGLPAQVLEMAQARSQVQAEEEAVELRKNIDLAGKLLAGEKKDAYRLQGGKAAETRELLRQMQEQERDNDSAGQKGDWGAFVTGNIALAEQIDRLDARHRVFFAEARFGCDTNIARGERLLKTRRLADGIVPPVRSSRGYDYKYQALRPETVRSDGAFNQVVIGVEEFPAEFVYETAPQLLELCFLTTRIKNGRRQPYLEGPASVFLASDFVGDGRVPTTARGEEFPVNLGADESVAVKRREERKRETTGLFTSYHRYRHEAEIAVRNGKARRVKVAVLDRVPFSEDRSVTIERLAVTPKP